MSERAKPSVAEIIRRGEVEREVDYLYTQWADGLGKQQGYEPTSYQRINYFKTLFLDEIWRRWPR